LPGGRDEGDGKGLLEVLRSSVSPDWLDDVGVMAACKRVLLPEFLCCEPLFSSIPLSVATGISSTNTDDLDIVPQ
jgi:hypothetical protein